MSDKNSPYETPGPGYPGILGGMPQPGMYGGNRMAASPYLNVDPSIFKTEPQYIMPEGANPRRGRLELAFGQIGGSTMLGAGLGGVNGIYYGLRDPQVQNAAWNVRRTQMLNYITKQSASAASTFGVMVLMYSCFGVLYSYGRGTDDELNTLAAATSAGLLFKSTSGWKRCLMGGGVGLGIGALICLYTSGDRIKQMIGR